MNYIKLNLPPTICDLVKCQELIDSKIKPTQFGVKLMRKFWSELNNATYNEKNQHTKLKKWVKSKQSPNELIAGSNLTQAEKDEVIFTDKYDTPKKVKEYIESVLNKAGVQDFLKKKTDELILWKQTSYTQKEIKQLLKSKKI